jgi:hypothetical protein
VKRKNTYLANIECLGGAEDKNPLGVILTVRKNASLFEDKFTTLHNFFIQLPFFL